MIFCHIDIREVIVVLDPEFIVLFCRWESLNKKLVSIYMVTHRKRTSKMRNSMVICRVRKEFEDYLKIYIYIYITEVTQVTHKIVS